MIIPFAIDPDALSMPGAEAGERLVTHRRMLAIWRQVGVLVHGGERFDQSELAQSVDNLPQAVRMLWQQAIKVNRLRPEGEGWRALSLLSSHDHFAVLRPRLAIGCLEETRAACLDVPFDDVSLIIAGGGPEICRFSRADQATRFQSAIASANQPIAKGEPHDRVWKDRFEPSVRLCRKGALLVDRYAVADHLRSANNSGLRRLFTNLERHLPRPQKVTIATSTADRFPDGVILEALAAEASRLRSGKILEIEAYLGPNYVFGEQAHYRYCRLERTILELDIGIRVLAGSKAPTKCIYHLRAQTTEDVADEEALRAKLTRHVFPCGQGAVGGRAA